MVSRSAARKRREAQARRVEAAGERGWFAWERDRYGRNVLRMTLDPDPAVALVQVSKCVEQLRGEVSDKIVAVLRDQGYSWADVAELLYVTPEAVRKRYASGD